MSGAQSQLWRMPGGIQPPLNKQQSLTHPIRQSTLPPQLVLPLTQPHLQQAEVCVQIGQRVARGQVLAKGSALTGITVHAPAAGVITAIGEHAVPNMSALPEPCIIITTDAADGATQLMPPLDYHQCDSATLIQRVADAGICGMGGAGFPAHAKLRAAAGKVETVIVNAVECEPYITTDDALTRERPADIVAGCLILLQITQATRCLIGIEDDKPAAIAALRQQLDDPRVQLRVIPTVYPSGGEQQLIYILTGREIAAGTWPTDNGLLCHNVATVHAIARAVIDGEPSLSRITTFTGAALREPGNFEVLIGTPVSHVLQQCGLDEKSLSRLLSGGSLMGMELLHADLPVTKTTNCIVATTQAEMQPPAPEQACIRCGFCSDVCPVYLLPQQLYWYARSGELAKAQVHNLKDCIECGACAYVCPSHIPLVQYFRAAKAEVAEQQHKYQRADHWRQRFEAHQHRKAAEKVLEDQRRAERAALAQKKKTESDAAAVASAAPAKPSAQDVIAAALARVQAKKAAAAADSSRDTHRQDTPPRKPDDER